MYYRIAPSGPVKEIVHVLHESDSKELWHQIRLAMASCKHNTVMLALEAAAKPGSHQWGYHWSVQMVCR